MSDSLESRKIKLKDIEIDGGTQPREEINEDIVAEYAEAMREGDKFPPVVVFSDGAKKWMADGFHRYFASDYLGYLEIEAEVKSGTRRDTVLYSVGANADHGLRRSNKDKRKAVKTLLFDEKWSENSVSWIAERANVSRDLVSRMIDDLKIDKSGVRKGKDGRTIDTANIGNSSGKRDIFGKKLLDNPSDYEPKEDNGYDIDETDLPDNVDPETGEIKDEAVGVQKAYEAISKLQEIPDDDEEMLEAFDLVIDWINRNK